MEAIFGMVREVNRAIVQHRLSTAEAQQVTAFMQCFDTVLGLLTEDEPTGEPQVEALLEERQIPRQRRDFTLADRLRVQIQELGYIIEATQQGARLKRLGMYK